MWAVLLINSGDIVQDPSLDQYFWPRFLMQVVIILTICKALGVVLGYVKQPPVIGEIIGGILVGPSVLGQWSWWAYHVFPPASISATSNNYITLVADLGIMLFLFMLGLELDERLVRRMWKTSAPIALASVLVPFAIGIALATWLFDLNNSYLSKPVDRTAFYLFTGASMSFTALPVLGSLLSATGLITTPVGIQAISCATVDDVLAWCVLAVSTAFATGDDAAGAVTFALAVAYISTMVFVVRPVLRAVHAHYLAKGQEHSHTFNYVMIITLLLAAFFSEIINIHSFFGALIAGLCAPKAGRWHIDAAEKLSLVTKQLLLPLFFVSSGAKTNIGSLNTASLVGIVSPATHPHALPRPSFLPPSLTHPSLSPCVQMFAVWAIATFAKFTPATLMTRWMTGRDWKFSVTVGVLMNTRGLVELIALNIGYTLGILSEQIFTVLVLMALLTTFCTAPLVYLIYQRTYVPELEAQAVPQLHVLHTVKEADLQQSPADAEVVWHVDDAREHSLTRSGTGVQLGDLASSFSPAITPSAAGASAPGTPKHFMMSGSGKRGLTGSGAGLTTSGGGRVTIHEHKEELISSGSHGDDAITAYHGRRTSGTATPADVHSRRQSLNASGPGGMRSGGMNTSGPGRLSMGRTPHPADTESHV